MKLYIETLGCPKNFNDSEGIAGIWERSGMNMTDDPAQADAILVNTCGFINDAKKESIDRDTEVNCSMKCRKWIFSLESTTMRNCLRS